jgi:hypothetical protein
MDPSFFYTYVNTLVFYNGMSKYNAIITFMNDPTIIREYKLIPEVTIETNDAIQLMNGIANNQQNIDEQNNNQDVNDDDYLNNPPPPPLLRRS